MDRIESSAVDADFLQGPTLNAQRSTFNWKLLKIERWTLKVGR
jgi:hypothetical protein